MLVAIVIVTLVVYMTYAWFTAPEYMKKIKAEPSLPLLGHTHLLGLSSVSILNGIRRIWEKMDYDTFRLDLGPYRVILMSSPEMVECILSCNRNVDKQDQAYGLLEPWLGTGLLISKGEKWHPRRKMLTPGFHFRILENYVDIFQTQARILVEKLSNLPEGKEVDVQPIVSLCALSAICETAMGTKINAQQHSSPYVAAIETLCKVLSRRIFSAILRPDFIFNLSSLGQAHNEAIKLVHNYTDNVIEDRRKQLTELKDESTIESDGISKGRRPFIDILLTAKNPNGLPLSKEDIREEVNTFMFEGHDTTTSGLSFTLYCLSQHPEVQQKVFKEQCEIFNDLNMPATSKELTEMKYLERVIKESLRLYPPVPIFGRCLSEPVTLPNGVILPKGSLPGIMTFLLHRNPKVFKNPETFDPDRFAPNETRHPYSYVPFSAGPRNCIGQKFAMLELKSIISTVVREFSIEPAPGHIPQLGIDLTLKSDNGVLVRFKKRSK